VSAGVAVYRAPQVAAPTIEPFRLFTIFFIWGEDDDFMLLGSNPNIEPLASRDELRETVLGWVKRERVCEWSTREAVYWNTASTLPNTAKRRGGEHAGRIYRNPADAHDALGDPSIKPRFMENFYHDVSPDPPHDQTRFPVLDWTPDERTPAVLPGKQLLKLGVVGDFLTAEGERAFTQGEIRDIQNRLTALRGAVEQTELLFVIDDTSSMKTWFQAAADSVLRILQAVRKETGKLRVAVAFYNDVIGGEGNGVDPMPLVDAQAQGASVVTRLRNHQPKEGGDPREMVFDGLVRSVREAGFSPHARKLVVLLGDMGDKSNENDPSHAAEAAVVAELLPDGESPLEFYTLHVVAADRLKNEAVRAFQTQMRTVVSEYRKKSNGLGQASYALLSDANQVRDAIVERFAQLQAEQHRLSNRLEELRRGQVAGTAIGPELEMLLREYQIDIDKLKATRGAQVFEFGYAWVSTVPPEKATAPDTMRYELLVDGGMLEGMINCLKGLRKFGTQPGKMEPRDILLQAIKDLVGEENVEWSFDEAMLKAKALKGLSVSSKLLRTKLRDIRNTTLDRDELLEIDQKAMLLEDARDAVMNQYELRETSLGQSGLKRRQWVRFGKPAPKERGFYIGGNRLNKWYWLEKAKEWP
ncbi:MAG TPA: vWA domain-containing protein, partial [Pirellulales bacterium]